MVTDQGSISLCIAALKAGDANAAQRIWERYFHRLIGLARVRLRAASGAACDAEDVALSAMDSFFRRTGRGRFPRLDDRDDIWQLLIVLTVRKAANVAKHARRLRRGGGRVVLLSELE